MELFLNKYVGIVRFIQWRGAAHDDDDVQCNDDGVLPQHNVQP